MITSLSSRLKRHKNRHASLFGVLLAALVLFGANLTPSTPARAASETGAETEAVSTLQDGLLAILNNPAPDGATARSAALGKLIGDTFDINAMGQVAVGVRTYRSWSPAQREKFLNAFARFMVATHASRFDGAANQGFAIEGSEDAQSGRKIVHARYLRAQRPTVAIDYLVQPTNDGWRILDVYLDQTISLLALHRSEFSSVLRDRGFDGFIAALHAKADEIAARPVAN